MIRPQYTSGFSPASLLAILAFFHLLTHHVLLRFCAFAWSLFFFLAGELLLISQNTAQMFPLNPAHLLQVESVALTRHQRSHTVL